MDLQPVLEIWVYVHAQGLVIFKEDVPNKESL